MKDLFFHVVATTEHHGVDAAADEVKTGKLLTAPNCLPALKVSTRDKPHGSRRFVLQKYCV